MKKKVRTRCYKGCSEKERIKFLTEARNVLLVNDHYTRIDTIEVIEGDNISVGYISKIGNETDIIRTLIDESQNYVLIKRSYIHHINGGNEEYITLLQFAGDRVNDKNLLKLLKIPNGSNVEFIHLDPKTLKDKTLDTGVQINYTFVTQYEKYTCYKETITSPIGLEVVSEKYIILINEED